MERLYIYDGHLFYNIPEEMSEFIKLNVVSDEDPYYGHITHVYIKSRFDSIKDLTLVKYILKYFNIRSNYLGYEAIQLIKETIEILNLEESELKSRIALSKLGE